MPGSSTDGISSGAASVMFSSTCTSSAGTSGFNISAVFFSGTLTASGFISFCVTEGSGTGFFSETGLVSRAGLTSWTIFFPGFVAFTGFSLTFFSSVFFSSTDFFFSGFAPAFLVLAAATGFFFKSFSTFSVISGSIAEECVLPLIPSSASVLRISLLSTPSFLASS